MMTFNKNAKTISDVVDDIEKHANDYVDAVDDINKIFGIII